MHEPLLHLACEILSDRKEKEGLNAVRAYAQFLKEKQAYFEAPSALEFLKKQKTNSPSKDFARYL